MKVKDFIPYFGLVHTSETFFYIGEPSKCSYLNKSVSTIDLIKRKELIYTKMLFEDEKYQDLELNEDQIYQLINDDHLHFIHKINRLPKEEVISEIRTYYDDYYDNGGDPLYWLRYMIQDVSNLISNYNVNIRHRIQVAIMEWYEIALKYEKYFHDNKDMFQVSKRHTNDIRKLEDIFTPKYHNSIKTFLDILRKTNPPVLNKEHRFINKNGNRAFLGMFLRTLNEYEVINIKLSKHYSPQISQLFGFTNDLLFNQKSSQLFLTNETEINKAIKSIIKSI